MIQRKKSCVCDGSMQCRSSRKLSRSPLLSPDFWEGVKIPKYKFSEYWDSQTQEPIAMCKKSASATELGSVCWTRVSWCRTSAGYDWNHFPPQQLSQRNCVTQLKLYTLDKLSSTIFCCLCVCEWGIGNTRPNLHFSNVYRHKSPLLSHA